MSTPTNKPVASILADVADFVAKSPPFLLLERPTEQTAGYGTEYPKISDSAEGTDIAETDTDDSGEEINPLDSGEMAHAQTAPMVKKRAQDLAFQEWLERNQQEVTAASKVDLERHLEKVSVSKLIKDDTKTKIISSPREYQIDLFERAKEGNTIVVLDTGSGKTLIAALLLRHVLQLELQNRAGGHQPKTAFFLVDKIALCFQQHAVLISNLEFPIGRFFGEMVGSVRSQQFWDEQFAENMAFVCTAQILFDLLNCGFISMGQINLLVFDEAHHAKKNHPYARIMKHHYIRARNGRPLILGMTASPADSLTKDVQYAAAELESTLCSKIATISNDALMESQAHRQQVEVKEFYQRLEDPANSSTQLFSSISRCVRRDVEFKGHLDFASNASSTLGTWCADRYWHLLTTETEMAKIEARIGRDAFSVSAGDEAIAAVGRVKKMVQDHGLGPISKGSPELSPKVKTLYDVLEDAFCRRQAKRCIVFVQERSTAFLLADLFQQPGMLIPGMKVSYMIGSYSSSASSATMSYRDQIMSLTRFRYGETNCLFATSVAEEGIDVPECDVIIRFDLYMSAIQYIQSKGRARQKSSLYVSMVEEGNVEHMRRLQRAARDTYALRKFCSSLPEDRKVQDFVVEPELLASHEQATRETYTIAETGARLTFITSLEVLARFASSFLGNNGDGLRQLEYIVNPVGKKFIARVVLPDASPVKNVSGELQQSKQLARCSAAFRACMQLIKKRYIDGHLQPTFSKKLPELRTVRLAIPSDEKSEYEMRIKPDFWTSCLGPEPPSTLYRTVITLDQPAALGRQSRPLILLTRKPLPDIPSAPLFFGRGQGSAVRFSNSQAPFEASPQEVEALAGFTLRLFAHAFSKEYDAKPHEIPYFVAPSDISSDRVKETEIDWGVVHRVRENERLHWEDAPSEFFKDRLAIDPWDGSRKFILNGVNEDLKPSDPTPKDVPQPKSSAYRKVEQTIKEYSNSLPLSSRKRMNWRDDQPVINAELLPMRRNFLDDVSVASEADDTCYIILEPLVVSPLPIDVVSMAMVLPVVMYRIDSVLIALEACSLIGLSIRSDLALEAMTKDSFNTEEHGQNQINFQPGMGKNYERLEFLGDTFLKMATSISVNTLFPSGDEFEYHVMRMLMLCNKNLFNNAVERGMPAYIRTAAFDRRTWYPSNMTLKRGKAARTEAKHRLSHKSIADVCEALIGAAYMTSTIDNMDMAVNAVTALVNSKNHEMRRFSDYFAAYTVPKWHNQQTTAAQRLTVDKVAEITGYRFQCAPLLRSAFRHPSYVFESNVRDYQRLEFLGDALLDMAVVDYLFKRFPDADPRWLTEHKMAMVSNQFLGCLCVKLGLHKHILLATSSLFGDIKEYVAQLEQVEEMARRKSRVGDAGTASGEGSLDEGFPDEDFPDKGARDEAQDAPRDFWVEAQQPPKALADVVEALVAGMFVDSGYSFSVVLNFFTKFIQPFFEDMALFSSFASNHPVTAMAHKLHDDFCCTQWKLHVANVPAPVEAGVAVLAESELLCALTVHRKVIAYATSRKSGSEAKVAVAKLVLEKFASIQDVDHFRKEMGCDCGGPAAASN
ncbi:endoribonuclease dicer [Trichoderma cornu-damae]|uniref:Dicer-like protein 1 n=1 Tax=Trichoderma cornu-damae TaxID=654480 RepID=A0A9P8TS60_9HYPO|nr:endoribonuclease dicer [Trichoderma cornu-damae]